jgi:hypothetical protein
MAKFLDSEELFDFNGNKLQSGRRHNTELDDIAGQELKIKRTKQGQIGNFYVHGKYVWYSSISLGIFGKFGTLGKVRYWSGSAFGNGSTASSLPRSS